MIPLDSRSPGTPAHLPSGEQRCGQGGQLQLPQLTRPRHCWSWGQDFSPAIPRSPPLSRQGTPGLQGNPHLSWRWPCEAAVWWWWWWWWRRAGPGRAVLTCHCTPEEGRCCCCRGPAPSALRRKQLAAGAESCG